MWHTPEGNRTLEGPEATLVAAAVSGIVDHIREESGDFGDQWEYGIQLFDSLTWTQRLAMLDLVAMHLLTPTPEPLELSAVAEATVAAVFAHVLLEIDWEIDGQPETGTRWRKTVLAAYQATEPDDDESSGESAESGEDYGWGTSSPDCSDRSAWRDLVESLMDQILWDRDYEMMADFADQPPEKAAFLKSYLGISDDYFSTAGPDVVSETEVAQRFDRLTKLVR